jgi:hypothetical protein
MDLQTLNAWLIMGNFTNATLEVPSINSISSTNSTSSNTTLFTVGEQSKPACVSELLVCVARLVRPRLRK